MRGGRNEARRNGFLTQVFVKTVTL